MNVILTNDSNNNSSGENKGRLGKIYNMLDKYSSKYFSLVDECKIVSKGFSKVLGMSLISDSYGDLVFFQPDGRMMAERQYKSMDNEITNVNNFAAWLQENDIDYIYVNVPSPVDPEEEDDNIFDIDNYDIKTSDEKCLREYGKIVTSVYADKTPIDLLYPKFSTNIRKMMPCNGMDTTGGFGEVMYYMFAYPTYNVYNHGIGDLKIYENQGDNVDDTKILLLTDSYSLVVSPFLACAYSNIDEIDLRIFNGSLQAYIEKNNPDIVITITSCYCINSASDLFEFK